MKVVIAGSRKIRNEAYVRSRIDEILSKWQVPVTEIVSGNAIGPDRIGETYAKMKNIPCRVMPADWSKYGKSAGPRRNTDMAKIADAAIVFWDGESTGTKHMISEMSRLKKPCLVEIIKVENGTV